MKKIIEISSSFTGKISTGSYENESPYFHIKEVYEFDGTNMMSPEVLNDEAVKERQAYLQSVCFEQFKSRADAAYAEKVAKTYRNIRFYHGQNGQKYPSVTSIIGWDADFFISPEELAQYAARGTIIDRQVEVFLKTGEWKEPKDIPEIYPELVTLRGGSLSLVVDDVDFRGFYKDYPFKIIECQKTHVNDKYRYGGRSDILCIIDSSNKGKWEKVDGVLFDVPTILDVKSGSIDKTKHFKQQTAYWKCEPEVKQVGLIPLNNDTKQGFSKPIIETNPDKYWSLFLKDREQFRNRYGV